MSRIQHLHHHHILEAVIGPHPLMKISAFSEAARPKQRATGNKSKKSERNMCLCRYWSKSFFRSSGS
jgi:hypothetical protein